LSTKNQSLGITEEVFGFAIENGVLDNKFMRWEAGLTKRGMQFINMTHRVYDCNEEIYKKLSIRFRNQVPTNLTIKCMNVSTTLLKKGVMPTIFFRECLNEAGGC
jgi:hypothetical protein